MSGTLVRMTTVRFIEACHTTYGIQQGPPLLKKLPLMPDARGDLLRLYLYKYRHKHGKSNHMSLSQGRLPSGLSQNEGEKLAKLS